MDLRCLVGESHHLPSLNPNPNPNLGPKISTAFKREERRKRKERKRQKKLEEKLEHDLQTLLALDTRSLPSHPALTSNIEWPCNAIAPNPISSESVWALPDPKPSPLPSAALPDPQKNVLKQCQGFFSIHEDDDEEDEDVLEFFEDLFAKDENLKGYYVKNWEKGGFCCLVCGAIGEKLGKRFGDCFGLVQHANTTSKTKRIGGHRAFGRAVCGVLGWDVDKFPSILMGRAWEVVDEVGLYNEVGDLVGPDKGDKGDSMDCMEADDDVDTD